VEFLESGWQMFKANQRQSIIRKRLLSSLDFGNLPRIILITAPSGYGKTVFAEQIAEASHLPNIFQRLNAWQKDISVLHDAALKVWQALIPQIKEAIPFTKNAQESAAAIGAYLSETLDQPCLYIFDEIQYIDGKPHAEEWLQVLLENLGEHITVILIGQSVPQIKWVHWVAKGQVQAFSFEDLRFSQEEVLELAQVLGNPSIEGLKALEGWAAGIRLALESQAQNMLTLLPGMGGSAEDFFKHLAEASFKRQDPDIQDFLLSTATVEEWDTKLCLALGLKDFASHFPNLLEQQLFLNPSKTGYRYHGLFRQFLQDYLQKSRPEQYQSLHQKAAAWYETQNIIDEAIEHYRLAGNLGKASQLAEHVAKEFYIYGRWESLLHFYETLPSQESPYLCFFAAMIYTERNQLKQSMKLLKEAQCIFNQRGDKTNSLRASLQIAHNLQREGRYKKAVQLGEMILAEADLKSDLKGWALRLIGASKVEMGLYTEAVPILKEAGSHFLSIGMSHARLNLLHDLNIAYLRYGDFEAATPVLSESLALAQNLNAPNDLAHTFNNLGFLYHLQSHYEDALRNFEEGLALLGSTETRSKGYLYWSIGDLYRDLGRYSEAEASLSQALKIAGAGDEQLHFGILLSFAKLRLWQGQFSESLSWLHKAKADLAIESIPNKLFLKLFTGLVVWLVDPTKSLKGVRAWLAQLYRSHNPLKLAQVLGLYWHVAELSENTPMLEDTRHYLNVIGPNFQQPFAAYLLNLNLVSKFQDKAKHVPELMKVIRLLEAKHQAETLAKVSISHNQLELLTLGGNEVFHNGLCITNWPAAGVRDLFFYLCFHEKQAKATIALSFWADFSKQQIRDNFHDTLKRLRKTIPGAVLYRHGYYEMNPDWTISSDAKAFRHFVQQARHLPPNSPRAEDLYQRSIALYQGDFLPQLDSDWVLTLRENFRSLYLEALLGQAQCAIARADWELALKHYEKAIDISPYSEVIAQSLMIAYARLGRKQDIQELYYRFAHLLYEDLGISTSAETNQLFQELLN
jgi:LuxR family transcriptional regulator, maltose regulon positive regulatory protein